MNKEEKMVYVVRFLRVKGIVKFRWDHKIEGSVHRICVFKFLDGDEVILQFDMETEKHEIVALLNLKFPKFKKRKKVKKTCLTVSPRLTSN